MSDAQKPSTQKPRPASKDNDDGSKTVGYRRSGEGKKTDQGEKS